MFVDVNPEILVWAREERYRGTSVQDIAGYLNVDISDLKKWEADGNSVPFSVIESMAKAYKRQTAVFFLPNVPPSVKKIKDCRNLAVGLDSLSPDTLLAVRRAERYLQVARELSDADYWKHQYEWMKNFNGRSDSTEQETTDLRELLGISKEGKIGKYRPDESFRNWRKKVEEKLGIFVFQFSMPEEEIDGFSYAFDEFPYAIVINSKKSSVRKTFTLFHELAHILKHSPGLCKTDALSVEERFSIERDCNKFSGEFLVPNQRVKAANSVDDIFELAKMFNISGEVYLRRMFELQKIDRNLFFSFLEEVRERSNNFPRSKKKIIISRIVQSKSTRGNKFFETVASAAVTNKISFSAASDLLGLKVGNIRL